MSPAIPSILLFLYFLFFLIHSDFYPVFWPDEVLFFSPTESLVKNFTLSTSVLSGLIEGMDRVTLWMPPLYFLYSALFQKLLGDSIFSSRLASFIASLLLFFPLRGIFHSMGMEKKKFSLFISLIFSDILFYKISATARMESLGLFFSLSAIYFLVSKDKTGYYLIIGILQGLAVMSHPFTIGFLLIEILFYFIFRKFLINDFLFGILGFMLPIFLWAFYVYPNSEIFFLQFGAQLGRKKDLLFSVFTIITKIKIILSGFKFPFFRGLLLFGISIAVYFSWKDISDPERKKRLLFFSGALIILFLLIFLSSESWYVYYIIPFLSFLMVDLYESRNLLSKILAPVWLLSNILGVLLTIYSIWIPVPVKNIQNSFFEKLFSLTQGKNKVYLQSIPDPYFYFKEKNPNLIIREFIPGELPLPIEFSKNELESQDLYIFYNEELIHPTIKNFLNIHADKFEKFEVRMESPKFFEYKYTAYVYSKKTQ